MLTIQGLRTQESKKFKRFFAIVQEAAHNQGCVFFFDSGDGRDVVTKTMEGEDLTGWLIPSEKASEFENEWKTWQISSQWDDYFTFAIWDNPKNITITFKNTE